MTSGGGANCPHCGGLVGLTALAEYSTGARWEGQNAATLHQTHPPRRHSEVADDLKKAIITGVLPGTLVTIPYIMASGPKPLAAWLLSSLSLTSAAWLYGQRPAAVAESETKPKDTTKKHRPTITLQIEGQADDEGDLMTRLNLDCDEAALRALANAWYSDESYAQAAMTGSGRPFSRGEYQSIVNQLMRRGLARWVSERAHSQGWEPTARGKAVLRHLSTCPTVIK